MVDIRPATTADLPGILEVLSHEGFVADDYQHGISHPVLVATDDHHVVGVCMALTGPPLAYLAEFAVRGDCPGKGWVAKSLMHTMEMWLRLRGCTQWVSFIRDGNSLQRIAEEWPGADQVGAGTQWRKSL